MHNDPVPKNVIHMSEAVAASDFAGLMTRVGADTEIIIESGKRPVAVLHAAEPIRRTISESIALAKAHAKESGLEPVMDANFAAGIEQVIKSDRKLWNPPSQEKSLPQPASALPNTYGVPFEKCTTKGRRLRCETGAGHKRHESLCGQEPQAQGFARDARDSRRAQALSQSLPCESA